MEKKKFNLGTLATGAGKAATEMFNKAKDKTVQIIDQNDDGKINLSDVSDIANAVGEVAKKTANVVKDTAYEKAQQLELRALQPIFVETLDDADFTMTKLIRLCERDKKHAESDVCQNSIGYYTDSKDIRMINIFYDCLDEFAVKLYPDNDSEYYYVDPFDRDCYIALDDYFNRLKVLRVNELQSIAQQLGAKHFKVTIKEEKKSFTSKSVKGKIIGNVSAELEHQKEANNLTTIDIAAEFDCGGHEPIMPELKYLQRDESIKNLINMRMHEQAPLKHQKIMISLGNTSGIKESDAIKIDAILKGLKCSGNTTVINEVQTEQRRYFEYEIVF